MQSSSWSSSWDMNLEHTNYKDVWVSTIKLQLLVLLLYRAYISTYGSSIMSWAHTSAVLIASREVSRWPYHLPIESIFHGLELVLRCEPSTNQSLGLKRRLTARSISNGHVTN